MIVFLGIILSLHLILLSLVNFTAWPEMVSYPYLILKGFSFYKDLVIPYTPGLVLLLAATFKVFGLSVSVLKIFTWIIILSSDLILYLILKKITKQKIVISLSLILFIFLQTFLDGNMLWFDLATIPFLLLAYLFSLKWIEKKRFLSLFLISLFLSLAVFIKQNALIYLMGFTFAYLILRRKIIFKEIVLLKIGFLSLAIPFLIYLLLTNSISGFWNWAFYYPLTEWSKYPGYINFVLSKKDLLLTFLLVLPLSGILINWKNNLKNPYLIFSLIFFIFSLAVVYPRFSFFHLQPALAFLIIILAIMLNGLKLKPRIFFMVGLCCLAVFITIINLKSSLGGKIRFYDQTEKSLVGSIKSQVNDEQKVFLLGLNSSLYGFSNTTPPSNWSDNFGWYLEIPGVQNWVLKGLKENPPELILWRIPSSGKWYELGSYQPQKIVQYIRNNYQKTGMINSNIEVWRRQI